MATLVLAACLFPVAVRGQQTEKSKGQKEPFINRVVIEGNEFFSDDELKRQLQTKKPSFFAIFWRPRVDRALVRRDAAGLRAFYHANGFLEARVEYEIREPVAGEPFADVVFRVEENRATRVEAVTFTQSPVVVAEDALRKNLILKSGVPFNPSKLTSDVRTIKSLHFERGYVAVAVRDSVRVENLKVWIHYDVVPGPTIAVGEITIQGNVETKTRTVEEELEFKPGDTFRLGPAVETQRNLFETGLFTEAEIIPGEPDLTSRTVDITVRVRERKSAYVEAGVGAGNVLGSRFFGEWGDRNAFAWGRSLRARAEYSLGLFEGGTVDFDELDVRVKFYRYDADFYQRRVLGYKVGLNLNAFLEKDATVEDLIFRTRGASIGGSRRFGEHTTSLVRLSQERIETESPEEGKRKSTSNIFAAGIGHDTRDFILDPRTGGYRDVNFEVGGGILRGDNDFYLVRTGVQKYFRRWRDTVFALRARVGYSDFFGQSVAVPIEKRFFTGGGNSVRGYDENSLGPRTTVVSADTGDIVETVVGGRVLLLTNAEVRFGLPLLSRFRFSGAIFADGGNVWADPESLDLENFRFVADETEVKQEDFRYSVGLGIRYNTPVGPIRLDYGIPLKTEAGRDEGPRFHISLGQIF